MALKTDQDRYVLHLANDLDKAEANQEVLIEDLNDALQEAVSNFGGDWHAAHKLARDIREAITHFEKRAGIVLPKKGI